MSAIYKHPMDRLRIYLTEYKPQLEKALAAIEVLETLDLDSEEFSDALAVLHVCATILEPYSEGMVEAIDRFTEDRDRGDSPLTTMVGHVK
jgi:uncharacterized caspase-like protein